MQWATEDDCHKDPHFMLKHCAESCRKEYAYPTDVKVGSRIEVYWEEDSMFYSAAVLKIRDGKANRFRLKWDIDEDGTEWFNLDKHVFRFITEENGEDLVVHEEADDESKDDADSIKDEEVSGPDVDDKPMAEQEQRAPAVGNRFDSLSSPIGFVYVTQQLLAYNDDEKRKTVRQHESKKYRPSPEPSFAETGDHLVEFDYFPSPIGFAYVTQKLLEGDD